MTSPYVAFVRKHHPQGWAYLFWAGITRREGNRRATGVCRHLHTSEADALRNTGAWGTHNLVKCDQCRSNYTDEELT